MMCATASCLTQNLEDFRKEWVSDCGSGTALRGMRFSAASACTALSAALAQALCANGAMEDQNHASFALFLDLAEAPEEAVQAKTSLAVVMRDAPDLQAWLCWQQNKPSCRSVLLIPPIFGAGLPEDYGVNAQMYMPDAPEAVHVTDLLRLLVAQLKAPTFGAFFVHSAENTDCLAKYHVLLSQCRPLVYTPIRPLAQQVRILRRLEQNPEKPFFDPVYAPEVLHRLQRLQLQCLLELDRVCKENGIAYFLGGGTLLGAAREQGFIPWDDDVDVMMTRENFDRFSALAPEKVGAAFFFQNSRTDPAYHSPFAKLRLRGTVYMTEFSSRFPQMHNEVFIDIFAHDAAPRGRALLKVQIYLTLLARSMVFHKWDETPLQFYGKLKAVCAVMSGVMRHSSIDTLQRMEHAVMTAWNHRDTGFLYDSMGEHLRHGSFPAQWLQEQTMLSFEGHLFPAPAEYAAYLRFSYGTDFMQWPTPSQRCGKHQIHSIALDSGKE